MRAKGYIAQFMPLTEKPGGWWVNFPDFPGCVTEADTFEQARKMARERLELELEDFEYHVSDPPAPMSLEQAKTTAEAYCKELGIEIAEGTFYEVV